MAPLEPRERRPHQQMKEDEHRGRIAGQREHDRARALGHADPRRPAGAQRKTTDELLDTDRGQRRTHVIVATYRDAAASYHHVVLATSGGESALDRCGRIG
ncbi:hypothetical protein HRbin41_01489 [bacterium HR41]|nr:hypothetical protein HRbin41_01489 [bacterium HR41]